MVILSAKKKFINILLNPKKIKKFFSSKKTDKEHTLQDFEQMLMNIDKEKF